MQASMMAEGVPYQKDILRDHGLDAASVRQRFVEECACVTLHHVTHFSIDPISTLGNIESFTGVAQVPLGFAGPMLVNGEHAQGRVPRSRSRPPKGRSSRRTIAASRC